MRHISLMCAGLALALMMNTDSGHDHNLMNLDDGADEPTSGGGSEPGEVAQDTPSDESAEVPADETPGDDDDAGGDDETPGDDD